MRAQGVGLDAFGGFIKTLSYRFLEPLFPRTLRLATAAGIEHHNSVIANFFLQKDLLRGVSIDELRRLFLWHFAEEIEHKEVVFKLLQSVSPAWPVRAAGLALSFATFLFFLILGTLLVGLKTGAALTLAFWCEAGVQCFGTGGLLPELLKESFRYLRPGFRPRVSDNQPLLDSALTELDHLGVDQPTPKSNERVLPAAFQEVMGPFFERVDALESRHPFFFSEIEKYDGPWICSEGKWKLNFCTYSYLGLLQHPDIQHAAVAAVGKYGTGTHGVRLLGGNLELHEKLEAKIAQFLKREAAITFSSGFMTNVALIGTLLNDGDFVLSDALNHASIVDGCRYSKAEVLTFEHSDMSDLEDKLSRLPTEARKLIVVDAVYSMDGDIAPIPDLIALRDRYPNTLLMVDEAHSLGVLGDNGRGAEEHFDCYGQIDVLMGTLSKTLPSQGGFIAASSELVKYLRYNARGFIFSAALSPAATAAALAGIEVIEREGGQRRRKLGSKIRYFTHKLRQEGFDIGNSETAIIPILLKDEAVAFEMARRCNLDGVYVMPVANPAVPKGTERLRMNVTVAHRQEDLDYAVQVLVRARNALAKGLNEESNSIEGPELS